MRNVAPIERVRLVVDRVGTVDATVVHAVPGAVELRFEGHPPAPPRFLHRRTARMHSIAPALEEVLFGTVLAVPSASGAVREDVVHVLYAHAMGATLAGSDPDRREAGRVAAERPVAVRASAGMADRWLTAMTKDVSMTGALLTGAGPLVPGQHVHVRLGLAATDPLEAEGRVTRAGPDGLRGLRLESMSPQDRLFLRRWLAASRSGLPAAD